MSASAWAPCPQCLKRREIMLKALKAELALAYGRMPLTQFDDLRKRIGVEEIYLADPEYHDDQYTLREDYEWYIKDGAVHGYYEACCQADDCDFEIEKIRIDHPFTVTP